MTTKPTHVYRPDYTVACDSYGHFPCTCGRMKKNARHAELQPLTAEQRAHDNARLGEHEASDEDL